MKDKDFLGAVKQSIEKMEDNYRLLMTAGAL